MSSQLVYTREEFFVTPKNFKNLQECLHRFHEINRTLIKRLHSAQVKLLLHHFLYSARFIFLGFLTPSLLSRLQYHQEIVATLEEEISHSSVELSYVQWPEMITSWMHCAESFQKLQKSEKMWRLLSPEIVNPVVDRTQANIKTKRQQIMYTPKHISYITGIKCLYLPLTHTTNLYLYPSFAIIHEKSGKIHVIELHRLSIMCTNAGYFEEEEIPSDSEIIDHAWKKANRDGTLDRRFTGNYKIPVTLYGALTISIKSTDRQTILWSNQKDFFQFAQAYQNHTQLLAEKLQTGR